MYGTPVYQQVDFVRLEPGESKQGLFHDRHNFFPESPGTYRVKFHYDNTVKGTPLRLRAWTGQLESPPFPFTISQEKLKRWPGQRPED